MNLLDGGIREIFANAFSGIYLDATLHRTTVTYDGSGGGSATQSSETVKAMFSRTTQAMREREGYSDTDMRILVLALNVDEIDTDCEITLGGRRWGIRHVGQDPARSYFDLHGRTAGNATAA